MWWFLFWIVVAIVIVTLIWRLSKKLGRPGTLIASAVVFIVSLVVLGAYLVTLSKGVGVGTAAGRSETNKPEPQVVERLTNRLPDTSRVEPLPLSYGEFVFDARPRRADGEDKKGWSDKIDTNGPRKKNTDGTLGNYLYPERLGKYHFVFVRLDKSQAVEAAIDGNYEKPFELPLPDNVDMGNIVQFRSMSDIPAKMQGVWVLDTPTKQECVESK